ncbi:MAG: hypothetical protein ACRDQA_20930 [Nocardioidaceae bacterium]
MTPASEEHRRRLVEAFKACELSAEEVWIRYFALGGVAGMTEIDAYINGLMPMAPAQHDVLAHAINERLDELAPPRAPYTDDIGRYGRPDRHRADKHRPSRHQGEQYPEGQHHPGEPRRGD